MNELVIKENGVAKLSQQAIEAINTLIAQEKVLKQKKDELNAVLLEQMPKYGVKQIKNDFFTISFTEEHTSERFDSKALKEQAPALYDSYCKESLVKASVRITPKKVQA